MFVNGNNYLKEYETQVLQMSVPPTESDQDSLKKNNGGNVPSSNSGHRYHIARYPSFNLDSISYITKDRTSKISWFLSAFLNADTVITFRMNFR